MGPLPDSLRALDVDDVIGVDESDEAPGRKFQKFCLILIFSTSTFNFYISDIQNLGKILRNFGKTLRKFWGKPYTENSKALRKVYRKISPLTAASKLCVKFA